MGTAVFMLERRNDRLFTKRGPAKKKIFSDPAKEKVTAWRKEKGGSIFPEEESLNFEKRESYVPGRGDEKEVKGDLTHIREGRGTWRPENVTVDVRVS